MTQGLDGVEYTPEFLEIDTLVNAHDAEGPGPLRKGEKPFQWDMVASASEALLARAPDLRVALWLLRAYAQQRGVAGLVQGLSRIGEVLALPQDQVFPKPLGEESAREAHAISLAWLGSPALLHQMRTARLAPEVELSSADMRADEGRVHTLDLATRGALAAQLQQGLQHLDQIAGAIQQDGSYPTFNLAPLRDEMAYAKKALQGGVPLAAPVAASSPAPTGATSDEGSSLKRREEVQQTLSRLIAYFKEHEPGHPAPLLLQRVQRMLGASFEDLMSELYADAQQLIARIDKPQGL